MAGTKITTTSSVGIKITQSDQNPVLVTATGTIVTNGNFALYDATTTPGKITNHGLLTSKAANGTGVEELAAKSKLTNTGTITGGGSGVYMIGGKVTLSNTGSIGGFSANGDGIVLAAGGKITNGTAKMPRGTITGGNDGILVEANGGTIANYGTISGRAGDGIKIGSGNATITNGAATATISGALYGVLLNANGTVSNDGTLSGQTGAGIYIAARGTVANGDATHTAGLISGGAYGVFTGGANSSLSNFGSITATANSGIGVALNAGGTLQNGAAGTPGGSIHGGLDGVLVRTNGARIANYGTITAGDGVGVKIENGNGGKETLVNGNGRLSSYLISGNTYGVSLGGDGTVRNDGTITAISGAGVYIDGTATIVNGDAAHARTMISGGRYGAYLGGVGSVSNFGTITGGNPSSMGLELNHGGTVQNGAAATPGAAIVGGTNGVLMDSGSMALTNFGAITGTARYGIFIENNDGANSIVNMQGGTIKGVAGIEFGGAGTLTNAGTITGTGGSAVIFIGTGDTLVVDPGAVFNGTVDGGGSANTLEFAAGSGSVGAIGTTFTHFGTVAFDSGATWSLTGSNAAANLLNNGMVTLAAGATLDITTAVGPSSTGVFQLGANATLEVAADIGAQNQMSFIAKSELIIDSAALFGTHVGTGAYAGPELENFGTGDVVDLKTVALASAALTYSAATGLLQISSGGKPAATLFFENSTLGTGSFHAIDDGTGHLLLTHH